jgi:hypothetical protein
MTAKDMDGSGNGVISSPTPYLAGGADKNHAKSQSGSDSKRRLYEYRPLKKLPRPRLHTKITVHVQISE